MISNELLKKKILDSAIHGELVENDLSLSSVDVESISEEVPFVIPSNWKWVRFESLGEITSSKRVFQNEWTDKGIPFYRARDIVSLNKGKNVSELYISEKMYNEYSEKYGIPISGDILLTGVGTIGESYIVKEKDRFYFKDGNIIWFKNKHNMNPKYMKHFFESNIFFNQIYETAKGATVLTLTISHAKDVLIPIPPLEEQEKIVSKIEELFELIDKKEKNDQEKTKLKEVLKSKILDSAIHGELVDNDLSLSSVDVESISEEVPFEIPLNWKWTNFELISNKISDGTHSTPKYVSNGVPFLSVKDMSNGILSFSNCKYITQEEHKMLYSRCDPKKGDLLITKVGTTGIPVVVDVDFEFSLFVSVAMLRFDEKKIYNKYIKYATLSKLVQAQIEENTRGAANKNWVIKDIKKTIIPLPPLEQQKKIVEKIEQCFELIEQL